MVLERVSSGLEELDSLLGGGFEKGSTVSLVSDPSSMKDAFLQQFARNALKDGHTVVYLCLVKTPQETAEELQKKYPELESFIKKRSIVFVNFLGEPFVERAGLDLAVSEFFGEQVTFQRASEFLVKDPKNLVDVSLTIKQALSATGMPEKAIVITESVADEFLSVDLQLALRFDRAVEASLKNQGVNLLMYVILKGIRDEFILPFEQHSDYVLEIKSSDEGGEISEFLRLKKSKEFTTSNWQRLASQNGKLKLVKPYGSAIQALNTSSDLNASK